MKGGGYMALYFYITMLIRYILILGVTIAAVILILSWSDRPLQRRIAAISATALLVLNHPLAQIICGILTALFQWLLVLSVILFFVFLIVKLLLSIFF